MLKSEHFQVFADPFLYLLHRLITREFANTFALAFFDLEFADLAIANDEYRIAGVRMESQQRDHSALPLEQRFLVHQDPSGVRQFPHFQNEAGLVDAHELSEVDLSPHQP